MDIQSVALGLVQGLTEFIPVSSSGHLVLIGNLFHNSDNLHLFIETLDFGTILALLISFRHKILAIFKQIFIEKNFIYTRNLILTALPVAVVGLLIGNKIEELAFFVNPLTVATALIIIGVVMIILEKLPKLSHKSSGEKMSWKRALGIGFAQIIALIPGSSRSGTTIIAGRIAGLNPKSAAEYSFLASVPVMLGLTIKLIAKDGGYIIDNWQPILIGNICAFIAGIIAIGFLISFLSKHSLKIFGVYRVILGIVAIILVCCGVLTNV